MMLYIEKPFNDELNGCYTSPYNEEDMLKFASMLVAGGFNVGHAPRDNSDEVGTFWHVAKWGGSLKLLEYLLSKGLNPNYIMEEGYSALDGRVTKNTNDITALQGQLGTTLKSHSSVNLPIELAELSTEPASQLTFFCPISILSHIFPSLGTNSTP